ncbi:MAG: hypothetical protein AAFV30_11225, partial [Pseudomonadota bacterium]
MQNDVIGVLIGFLPLLATVVAVLVLLGLTNWILRRHWRDDPSAQFRFQFIMLATRLPAGSRSSWPCRLRTPCAV